MMGEDEKQNQSVCFSKRAGSMVVRGGSAAWNCPTRSRIGVIPVVEGDTEKARRNLRVQKLCVIILCQSVSELQTSTDSGGQGHANSEPARQGKTDDLDDPTPNRTALLGGVEAASRSSE
jgi:hypothetical protein